MSVTTLDPIDLRPEVMARRFDLLAADATEYALFLVDAAGRVLCWNSGAEHLFGYRADEVVGEHLSRFFSPEDTRSGQCEHELETACQAGTSRSVRWQVRKNGSRFWCQSTLTSLHDEAKQLHTFARVMHDLTAEQAGEAETRRADGLADANRGKEDFMAMLSHELRNPLSPILHALGVLKKVCHDDPVVQQAGGVIERQVGQMVRMVDDLLDISRMTKGKLRLTTERVELRTVMARAADSARPLLDARRHEFSLILPTEPIWIEGDPGRLEQVAVNLLSNASKYTDTGGWVRMTVAQEGAEAVVRVADNGMGIPADMLPKIFELFTQVDASLSRSNSGLGIGLALVRTLVEMHGGRVTATSKGRGCEFEVRLPAPVGGARRESAAPAPPETPAKAMLRVLIVEDNIDAGDSLSMLLRLHGFEVLVARTGAEALTLADSFRPAVAFVDIGLPGMDGYEVSRRLRANPDHASLRLCALTGYTPSEADRLRPQQSGFDQHFVKPVSLEALLGVIKSTAG